MQTLVLVQMIVNLSLNCTKVGSTESAHENMTAAGPYNVFFLLLVLSVLYITMVYVILCASE